MQSGLPAFTGPISQADPQKMQAGLMRHTFSTSSPYADIEYYTGKIGSVDHLSEVRIARFKPRPAIVQ